MFCLNFNYKLTLMFKLATIQYPVKYYPVSGKVVSDTSLVPRALSRLPPPPTCPSFCSKQGGAVKTRP